MQQTRMEGTVCKTDVIRTMTTANMPVLCNWMLCQASSRVSIEWPVFTAIKVAFRWSYSSDTFRWLFPQVQMPLFWTFTMRGRALTLMQTLNTRCRILWQNFFGSREWRRNNCTFRSQLRGKLIKLINHSYTSHTAAPELPVIQNL